MQSSSSEQQAVRTSTTTAWLWIVVVLNAVVGLYSFTLIGTMTALGLSPFTLIVGAFLSFGIAVGAYLILQWKKMGFYIAAGCVAINIILNFGVGTIVSGLLGLGVLYYVLQYPKDNKAWDHLK